MHRRVLSLLILLIVITTCTMPVLAQDTSSNVEKAVQPLVDKINKIVRAAQAIIIAASVLVFVYAGALYMTAEGEPNKEQKARKVFIGGVIGLCIVVLAEIIRAVIITLLS